jgi:hypothetical protein
MADPLPMTVIPLRQHDFEQHPDGLVTVLVPKFTSPLSRRFLVPLLKKPDIRMHLDAVGSAVWTACDGSTSLHQLAEMVRSRFGGTPDEARERVQRFLLSLRREGSITFIAPADAAGPS